MRPACSCRPGPVRENPVTAVPTWGVRWMLRGLVLATLLLPAGREARADRVLVAPRTELALVTTEYFALRIEPEQATLLGWIREGSTWALPPVDSARTPPLTLRLPWAGSDPLQLFRRQTPAFDEAVLLFKGSVDNPPIATLTLTVQTATGKQFLTYSQDAPFVPTAEFPMKDATFRPKNKLYLLRRELGLARDDDWRVTQETGFTIIQRRFDERVSASRLSRLLLEFAPDFDFSKAGLNLRFSQGGGRPTDTVFTALRRDSRHPGQATADLPLSVLSSKDDIHLAEVIVFVPGSQDPASPTFPLRRVALESNALAGLTFSMDAAGTGRLSLAMGDQADLPPDAQLQEMALQVRPSRPDLPFAFRPTAAWLGRKAERPVPLFTTRGKLALSCPPWEQPETWTEADRLGIPGDSLQPVLGVACGGADAVRANPGRVHLNGTCANLDIPLACRGLPSSLPTAFLLRASGDLESLASAEASWEYGGRTVSTALAPGLLAPLAPGQTAPPRLTLHLHFLRMTRGLDLEMLLYARDPAGPASGLLRTTRDQKLTITLPSGPSLFHRLGPDSATFLMQENTPATPQSLLLAAESPLPPRRGVLSFQYAAPWDYTSHQPRWLTIEARGKNRRKIGQLYLPGHSGRASTSLGLLTGSDWPDNEPIESLALTFVPRPPSGSGTGLEMYSFEDFTLESTILTPWPEVLGSAALSRSADAPGNPSGLPEESAQGSRWGDAWIGLPPDQGKNATKILAIQSSAWRTAQAVVLPWTSDWPAPHAGRVRDAENRNGTGWGYLILIPAGLLLGWYRLPLAAAASAAWRLAHRKMQAGEDRLGRAASLPWLALWGILFAWAALGDTRSAAGHSAQSAAALAAVLAWRGLGPVLRPLIARHIPALRPHLEDNPWSWPLTGATAYLAGTLATALLNLPALVPGHFAAASFLCLAWALAVRLIRAEP